MPIAITLVALVLAIFLALPTASKLNTANPKVAKPISNSVQKSDVDSPPPPNSLTDPPPLDQLPVHSSETPKDPKILPQSIGQALTAKASSKSSVFHRIKADRSEKQKQTNSPPAKVLPTIKHVQADDSISIVPEVPLAPASPAPTPENPKDQATSIVIPLPSRK
jgi:hypothetical protein